MAAGTWFGSTDSSGYQLDSELYSGKRSHQKATGNGICSIPGFYGCEKLLLFSVKVYDSTTQQRFHRISVGSGNGHQAHERRLQSSLITAGKSLKKYLCASFLMLNYLVMPEKLLHSMKATGICF